jgi:two-component system, NtrC family, sensor kinase
VKLLLADDDIISRRPLERTLTGLGYEVIAVEDGEHAWEELSRADAPEIAILDWMMPELDGIEVCRRARARPDAPYVYVLLLTSRSDPRDLLDGLDAGADDYLTKPFDLKELDARLRAGARVVESQRELRRHIGLLQQAMATIESQQQAILQASKMSALGEMAGGIAHEINNPLAVVSSSARQIQHAATKGDLALPLLALHAGRIRAAAGRISTIVSSLMSFAKDDRADVLREVSATTLCDETLNLCRERITERGIRLMVELDPPDLELQCRPNQLKQVLYNLLSNAADAAERMADPWIVTRFAAVDDAVEISVIDSGEGVPERSREDVFRPFFTTKPIGQGPGLGLSVAKGIVESHGGALFLDDAHPHTRFVARLPSCATARGDVGGATAPQARGATAVGEATGDA